MTHDPNARSKALTQAGLPAKTGLYDPANEHDACGIGMIANIHNDKSHRIIADGLRILENLEHRGAVGADPKAGDGAGILIQIPHDFFAGEAKRLGFDLPAAGDYGVGFVFMPRDPAVRERIEQIFDFWTWTSVRNGGSRAFVDVPAAGEHVIDVWMREDGMQVDKIMLTTDSALVPTSFGATGPSESPRG